MKIEKYLPSAALKPFIQTFMIIESENGMENRILPDTSPVMAFRYKGKIMYTENGIVNRLPTSVVSGVRKSPRLVDYSKNTATLIVSFHEGGAAAFFNEPIHELFGISVSLDDLIPRHKLNEIEEQLSGAIDNRRRIVIIEKFMLSILKEPLSDPLVINAVQKIKATNGDIRIKELLTTLPISRDPFEKRFRRLIGTSPKQFSVIVRLKHLITNYSPPDSLTDAAHNAGYFDQAHFIKDFKLFTGQTPQDFFKSSPRW
jgi:AraC-like DNA-binding protein